MKVACPTCGAEVDFRYDDSFVRVCGHCRAAVVRGDRGVESLGRVADLAPTGSPLALFADGRFRGQGFLLVGRAQYRHPAGGVWDEWYAKLDDGTWGWLAEAQGRFYLTFETVGAGELPGWAAVFPGATVQLLDDGPRLFTVGERGVSELAGAEGEIPFRFVPGARAGFADLADGSGRFATIDYGDPDDARERPTLYLGRQVGLAELGLSGGEVGPGPRAIAGKQLACPQCGGSLELRAPDQSMRVVCPYCSSLLSCEGDLQLIAKLNQPKAAGALALGSRCTFDGVDYTVIGRLRRKAIGAGAGSDDSDDLAGEIWTWDEYLLYQPAVGFRWLVESSGHWSFVTTLPPGAAIDEDREARYDGQRFRLFDRGAAKVIAVYGELYWRVQVGERVKTTDFVAPPAMLSWEASKDEVNWSLGVYLTRDQVRRAFRADLDLPRAEGVGAAQPFRHRHAGTAFGLALVALVVLTLVRLGSARNHQAYQATLALESPPAEAAAQLPPGTDQRLVFSESFTLVGKQNVVIALEAPIDNNWIYVAGDLVHEASGKLRTFDKEVSYYHGFDGGESWSEGGRVANVYLGDVEPGRYLLRLEVLQPPGAGVESLRVTVRQGVFRFLHVIIAAILVGVPGLLLVLWHWWFERRRWKNSDYAPKHLAAGDDE